MNKPINYQKKHITAEDVLAWICGGLILLFGLAVDEAAVTGTGVLVMLVNTCNVCTR